MILVTMLCVCSGCNAVHSEVFTPDPWTDISAQPPILWDYLYDKQGENRRLLCSKCYDAAVTGKGEAG